MVMKPLISALHALVTGPVMLVLLSGTGIYYTCVTGAFQARGVRIWLGQTLGTLRHSTQKAEKSGPHDITPFQSFTTALAGTLGTGNIVGVATAICAGGPGAIFWMWVSALLGMMTSYAENVLGTLFRRRNSQGEWEGGPMVYLEHGLHSKGLAVLFAAFTLPVSIGMGNMAQGNGMAMALEGTFDIPPWVAGGVCAAAVALIVIGGVKRIGAVTEKLIPLMALGYIIGAIIILCTHATRLPAAFGEIFVGAFAPRAAVGGVGGYTFALALRYGVSRGVFSNEAGLGSSVMIHAAGNVTDPSTQGMWGMCEVFIDTIVMCTVTALCLLCTGVLQTPARGAQAAVDAFASVFGAPGAAFVAISIALFALSTMLCWSYIGERAAVYLFGAAAVPFFRVLFVSFVTLGCIAELELVWTLSDIFNGLMALPNLIGLFALRKIVLREACRLRNPLFSK